MKEPIVLSVGGGKGGVGKSTIVAGIGANLAHGGRTVGFVDADLGGANLHLFLGVRRPKTGLGQFLLNQTASLADVKTPTAVPNTWLVTGVSDTADLANPTFGQKQRLIAGIGKLEADYVFVDLGAGADTHVTDFFAAFPYSVVVSDGMPASVENAYGYLKNGVVRGLTRLFAGRKEIHSYIRRFSSPAATDRLGTCDELLTALSREFSAEARMAREWLCSRKIFLVLNMVRDETDISRGTHLALVAKKYLGLNIIYIGYVIFAPEVRATVRDGKTPGESGGSTRVRQCIESVAQNLAALTKG